MGTIRKGNGNATGGVPFIPFSRHSITSPGSRSHPQPGDDCPSLVTEAPLLAHAVTTRTTRLDPSLETYVTHTLTANFDASEDGTGRGLPLVPSEEIYTLCDGQAIPQGTLRSSMTNAGDGVPITQLRRGVRKLMPIECERLQGFPDDWTRYGADGEEFSDSVRYEMIGNAVPPPVVAWILKRLKRAA